MDILGHYVFLSICGYLTGLLCFGLSGLVLQSNPRSRSCQLAFLFNFSVAIWAISYATMYFVTSDRSLWVNRILTVAAIMLNTFFTHLTLITVNKEAKRKNFILLNYIIGSILSFVTLSTKLIVIASFPKLDFPAYIAGGPFYILVPGFLFANLIFSSYQLANGIKNLKGYRKSQLSLFLIATLIGYGSGTPAFLLGFNIPVKPLTTPLLSLFPIILSYAIIKHRFLDIRKLVKNSLVFSFLFIALLGFASVILLVLKETISRWIGIPDALAQALAIALAIGLYAPLKGGLSRLTNRMLFQHSENPEIIFRKLSEDILHYLDTDKLTVEVTRRVAEILALDRIGFYLRPIGNPYFFELVSSLGRIRKGKLYRTKQLVQYLERAGDYIVNPHTRRETRTFSKKPSFFGLTDLKSIKQQAVTDLATLGGVAAFPIFVKDDLRGILLTGRKKSDAPWREEEFRILKSFMRYLALALANAEYAEELRRSRAKLSESERDALAGALISGVGHEARNPLQSMSLALGTLKSNLADPSVIPGPYERIERLIEKAAESVREDGRKLNSIIQHLSDLSNKKLIAIKEDVRPVHAATKAANDLVRDKSFKNIRVALDIPETLLLACDPDALYEILVNLTRNAAQATESGGEVILRGFTRETETVLQVLDSGLGIPRSRVGRIFEPFFTTKRGEDKCGVQGSGMGLFLVRQYMQEMGGTIEVESEHGKGTVFTLRFPSLEPLLREAA